MRLGAWGTVLLVLFYCVFYYERYWEALRRQGQERISLSFRVVVESSRTVHIHRNSYTEAEHMAGCESGIDTHRDMNSHVEAERMAGCEGVAPTRAHTSSHIKAERRAGCGTSVLSSRDLRAQQLGMVQAPSLKGLHV